ncbi:MAG: nucleotidyltransferase domain-containing protein [Chloroflexi bacterium]|nr:MAG: nucleotidyltransferase domain-containing protein [Chloroflexota bacterium]
MPDADEIQGLLDEITRRILTITKPEQIILFGSYARGNAGPASDLDLLVIIKGITHPRRESTYIRRALRGLLVPIDVIVATPEQIRRYQHTTSLIYESALREGKVLYERTSAS